MKDKIHKVLYKMLIIASLSILLFGSVEFIYDGNNIFKVNNILVNGCNLIQKKSLHDLYWPYFENKSIFNIDEDKIEAKLLENKFISSVNLIKLLPNTLILDIIEISPIGIIKTNNHNIIVDSNNNKFVLSKSVIEKGFQVPELLLKNSLDEEKIFDTVEYEFLNYVFSNYPKLYNRVRSIELSNNHIIIKLKNCIITLNSQHYLNKKQLKKLSKLIKKNKINFDDSDYEYIKFALENVIIRERESI